MGQGVLVLECLEFGRWTCEPWPLLSLREHFPGVFVLHEFPTLMRLRGITVDQSTHQTFLGLLELSGHSPFAGLFFLCLWDNHHQNFKEACPHVLAAVRGKESTVCCSASQQQQPTAAGVRLGLTGFHHET
eukprot:1157521-Pelagomonas_calceolata.AAC.10